MDLMRPEALERMTRVLTDLPTDEVGPYFLLCMAVLAKNAPEVAHFIMDRADERLADALAQLAGGD